MSHETWLEDDQTRRSVLGLGFRRRGFYVDPCDLFEITISDRPNKALKYPDPPQWTAAAIRRVEFKDACGSR